MSARIPGRPTASTAARPPRYAGVDLTKTKLCLNFERGACTFGTKCKFAHGADELRALVKPDRGIGASSAANLYKTRLCHAWTDKGECERGDDCRYAHGESDLRQPGRPRNPELVLTGTREPAPPQLKPPPAVSYAPPEPLPEHGKDKLKWAHLTADERSAASTLEYDETSWNFGRPPRICTCPWQWMPSASRRAAAALGYDEDSWNAELVPVNSKDTLAGDAGPPPASTAQAWGGKAPPSSVRRRPSDAANDAAVAAALQAEFDAEDRKARGAAKRAAPPPGAPTPTAAQREDKYGVYKTKLCRTYMETGACPRGDACGFAHGEAELRTKESTKERTTSRPPTAKGGFVAGKQGAQKPLDQMQMRIDEIIHEAGGEIALSSLGTALVREEYWKGGFAHLRRWIARECYGLDGDGSTGNELVSRRVLPEEICTKVIEILGEAIGGEPMGLNALGLRLRDARMWQRPPIELRKFLISRCPEVVVTLGADVGGASDATVALAE